MQELNYEQALRLEGEVIRFKNKEGKWAIGRVAKVRKDGLEMEELTSPSPGGGYGLGFWGPGPFWGPPGFFAFAGFGFAPFFLW